MSFAPPTASCVWGSQTRVADGFSLSERSAIGKFLRQRFNLIDG